MNGKDWNDLGGDLNRIIEDAVHMGDFGRLNENINRTIKKAFQGISGEEFRSGDGWDFDLSGKNGSRNNGTSNNGAAGQASQQAGPAGHENRQQGQAEAYDYGRRVRLRSSRDCDGSGKSGISFIESAQAADRRICIQGRQQTCSLCKKHIAVRGQQQTPRRSDRDAGVRNNRGFA